MNRIVRWLKNRVALGAFAAVALAVAVWFVGDVLVLVGRRPLESDTSRGVLAAVIVLAWIAFELARSWRARAKNLSLIRGIAGVDDSSAEAKASREIETLRNRFTESMGVLQSRLRNRAGERQYLYQLPWYVIIGAPGSGKTTALINSGLRFPLESSGSGHAVKGVGGTRNCDWWFTDEAVLLDTAGRYTTQDSENQVDRAAWEGFLDLLKKFRPRQPLNGALVTVSVSDLLSQDEEQRKLYAMNVRQRIADIYLHLGVRFPIYLLVTKTDLLAGFMEFFGDYGREAREQVWGVTFPLAAGGSANYGSSLTTEFARLERQLNSLLIERLREEHDPQRRSIAYTFPQQFSALGPLLVHFVDRAFRGSAEEGTPLLRGVYFTSGTQEGSPIDRVLGTLARTFNLQHKVLPPAVSSGKSFFLIRLLREVVFMESGLAGLNEQAEAKRRRAMMVAYSGSALVTAGLVTVWTLSFLANRSIVTESRAQVGALKQKLEALPGAPAGDPVAVVQLLNGLRDLPGGYAKRDEAGKAGGGFGLQPAELSERQSQAYRRLVGELLLPRLTYALDRAVRSTRDPSELSPLLAAYTMMFDDKLLQPKALVSAAGRVLRAVPSADLERHLMAALESRPISAGLPFDPVLVEDARRRIEAVPKR